jgi:hypothetical protein
VDFSKIILKTILISLAFIYFQALSYSSEAPIKIPPSVGLYVRLKSYNNFRIAKRVLNKHGAEDLHVKL